MAVQVSGQRSPEVTVELNGNGTPRAYVTLRDLLSDGQFVNALESGFPLYLAYRVELRQSQSLWDRTASRYEWEFVVLYDPVRERFVLEDPEGTEILSTRSLLRERIGQVYQVTLEPQGDGEFYYRATVEARTLEDGDVDEVFEWLGGETADSLRRERPGLLIRTARSLLLRVAPLPRVTVTGESQRFRH